MPVASPSRFPVISFLLLFPGFLQVLRYHTGNSVLLPFREVVLPASGIFLYSAFPCNVLQKVQRPCAAIPVSQILQNLSEHIHTWLSLLPSQPHLVPYDW